MALEAGSFIGIDYSGAETPTSRLKGLQVYEAAPGKEPKIVKTPSAPDGKHWNWTRTEIAEWLISKLRQGEVFIAGIDHGFSFPMSYMARYGITSWDDFLTDFVRH